MRDVEVTIGNLTIPKRVVKPPEMVVVNLTRQKLEKLEKRDELEVSVGKKVER